MNAIIKPTAGALSLKAAGDLSRYDGREVAEAQLHDVMKNVMQCAQKHHSIMDEEEYFVIMVRASDPLLQNLVRQKFYCYLYMPSPRPEQAVWLYNKTNGTIHFLWSLPPAKVMAAISEAPYVNKEWRSTRKWVDSFYKGTFWSDIRKQYGIDHLSEHEYLLANRDKFIKAGMQEGYGSSSEPFDFSKVMMEKVIDPLEPLV